MEKPPTIHDRANSVPSHRRFVAFAKVKRIVGDVANARSGKFMRTLTDEWVYEGYGATKEDAVRDLVRRMNEDSSTGADYE